MELTDLMDQDSKSVRAPSNEELETVSNLANEQLRLEQEVEEQEAKLKATKEKLVQVREFDLPTALERFGLTSITLTDKVVISVKEEIYAGITNENKERAFEWLENTENDGIIKEEVKLPFGKGQKEEVEALTKLLDANGYSYTSNRSVHPQTLKSFVKHQLEDGLPIPMDVFSVHIKKVAKIELPRTR